MNKSYYGRHNLPGAGLLKTKIVSMATVINRNFYRSLRKKGRSHYEIMSMIQPERLAHFTKDILPIHNALDLKPVPHSPSGVYRLLERIKNFF